MTPIEGTIVKLASELGPFGLIFAIWWFDRRDFAKMFFEFQQTTMKVLAQYQTDMNEQRRMYENNVELVRSYASLARDLKDVIVTNTAASQAVRDDINSNRFCPAMRDPK